VYPPSSDKVAVYPPTSEKVAVHPPTSDKFAVHDSWFAKTFPGLVIPDFDTKVSDRQASIFSANTDLPTYAKFFEPTLPTYAKLFEPTQTEPPQCVELPISTILPNCTKITSCAELPICQPPLSPVWVTPIPSGNLSLWDFQHNANLSPADIPTEILPPPDSEGPEPSGWGVQCDLPPLNTGNPWGNPNTPIKKSSPAPTEFFLDNSQTSNHFSLLSHLALSEDGSSDSQSQVDPSLKYVCMTNEDEEMSSTSSPPQPALQLIIPPPPWD
jgi:hypothetical protein